MPLWRAPAAGIDLSGDKTRYFNMSYDHLIDRGMVDYYFIGGGPTGNFPALKTGSSVSKLTGLIETGHANVNVDDESRRSVYAWIDSNVQYYSTWDMSRPWTTGGRDTWFSAPANSPLPFYDYADVGKLKPELWLVELLAVYDKNCVVCHGPLVDWRPYFKPRQDMQVNLTRPEFSRLLNAHLSKGAGGMGIAAKKDGRGAADLSGHQQPYLPGHVARDHQGQSGSGGAPRMDMPGGKPVPQKRDFGRTFM